MKSYTKGIDVSEHNGVINWKKVKAAGIQFAMLRAGYGQTIDKQFKRNISECNRVGLPCGVYWFSYALNAVEAKREALACLDAVRPFRLSLPAAFDLEYDSVNYARKHGVYISTALASGMADTFCRTIQSAGYPAMNYANADYLRRYFDADVQAAFPVWLAQWPNGTPDPGKPPRPCGIWQYSAKGSVPGIKGPVDQDVCYLDFTKNENNVVEEEEMRYNKISDMPGYAQPTIIRMVDNKLLEGTGTVKDENNRPADLDLSLDMIRVFVTNDRAGLYAQRQTDSVQEGTA